MNSGVAVVPGCEDPRVDMEGPIVFFDGECGYCNRAIRFAMSRDRDGRLYAAPLDGETARKVLSPFKEALAGVDSVVLYLPATPSRPASALVHSTGALGILQFLGGGWPMVGTAALLIPRWLRDGAYQAFTKHRYRLFGRVDTCQLWPPAWRARMLP